jgi:hypothetical protein
MADNDENRESGDMAAAAASAGDVVMISDEAATTLPTTISVELAAPVAIRAPDSPPPRKRARRFVRTIARTAGAVSIGAVVTWSALAFS